MRPAHPYALAAAMLLLALVAVGATYMTSIGSVELNYNGESYQIDYRVMEYTIHGESQKVSSKYSDNKFLEAQDVRALLVGSWLVPIGALLLLAAFIVLMAATGKGRVRLGATLGQMGSAALLVAAAALLWGFMDNASMFADIEESVHYGGKTIGAGSIWIVIGIAMGLGGSLLAHREKYSPPGEPHHL